MSKASDFLLGKVSSSDENDEVIQPNTTDITGDTVWKYIDAGDISGFADWTNRNMNYRDIPFLGQFVGHTADAATQGVADMAQFVGADGVSDYLNEKAQEGESYLPPMTTPELSLDYVTDPNGLASATGMLVGSMLSMAPATMLVPETAALRIGSLLKGLPKIGTVASEFAPKAVKWAATGPVEAAMEGGNTERQMLQNGATPEEAKQAAWDDFYGNVGLLTATNALEGGLLGKVARVKTPTFQNGLLNTASKMAGYAPATAAEAALQGYEEGAQQGIQEGAMHGQMDMNHILNPNDWDDEQWENAKFAVAGGLPLVGGSALVRHVGNRGGSPATDSAMGMLAEAEASTNAKLAADHAAEQKAEEPAVQPAVAVAEPEAFDGGDSGADGLDVGFGKYDGQRMDNGANGCVEAVTKIGASYSPFLAQELSNGVVGVPKLVEDAGDAVIPFSPENVERGDIIVYGDNDHVVTADGNGGYYGNSSSQEKVIHGDNYNAMGGLTPTKIIKTGGQGLNAGASAGGLTLSSGDQQIDAWIQEAADANGVPANLLSALLDVESGYNVDTPNSEAGAIGIAQFMPGTAESMGIDPHDPHQSIEGAARLLKQEYDHYGNWSQALEAYNGGEGNVGSGETQAYAQKVLGKAGDISHVGGGSRSNVSSTNFMNERPSFDINSDDATGRKMISDFIDYWGNRADVDDADTIQGMLDANGKFRNTQENRDTVREKWQGELQAYADDHMTDEQKQALRAEQMQKRDAEAARDIAKPNKKAAKQDAQPIDVSTPNLDAAKEAYDRAVYEAYQNPTPENKARALVLHNAYTDLLEQTEQQQAAQASTAGESKQPTESSVTQLSQQTAHSTPNTEPSAPNTAHPQAVQTQTAQAANESAQPAHVPQPKIEPTPAAAQNSSQNAAPSAQANAQQPQAGTDTQAPAQASPAAQADVQTAQPTAQANQQAKAKAAQTGGPIEQDKAPNVPKNDLQNAQASQTSAQPQGTTLDAQQATKQQNALPQPAQTPQQAKQMSPAEQRARASKEQRLQKELETNATLDQIERGQQLERIAQQNKVAMPHPLVRALHRGQPAAIEQATSILKNEGVSLPTVEASGNTVYGAAESTQASAKAPTPQPMDAGRIKARAKQLGKMKAADRKKAGRTAVASAQAQGVTLAPDVVKDAKRGKASAVAKAEAAVADETARRETQESSHAEATESTGRENSAQNAAASRTAETDKNAGGQQTEKPSSKKETSSRKPAKGAVGKAVTVTTDSGKELHARYRIVKASDLVTSNVYDGDTIAKNDAYPQELQPRERSGRKEMQAQTDGMAANLHPADLEASRNLNQGAPLIRSDGVVLNGNGRTMAITRAYALRNKAGKRYTQYLIEHAEDFGFTKDQMRAAVTAKGMDKPILVRELTDDADEATTQDIINSKTGGARMSATEQAETDAKSITSRDFDGYDAESDGDLTKAGNDGFVAKLLRKLVGKDEINAYTDANGSVNQDGYLRVKRAIFSRAYGDTDLIAKMAESMDDAIKNISNGLQSAAANVARLNLKMQEGNAYSYPLADTIARAVKKYNAIKEGKAEANVEAYASENENPLFEGDPEEVVKMVEALDDYHRSGKKVGNFLNHLARILDQQGSPKEDETALDFGEASKPLTLAEAIDRAKEQTDAGGEQNLFGGKKYSIEEAKERRERTLADLKREIASAFPGAKNVREDGDRIAFDMPNGSHVDVRIQERIDLSPEEAAQAKRDHGVAGDVSITVNGYEVTVGRDAIIALSKAGERGTAHHEALHIAMELLFNDREKAALAKKFGKGRGTVEERIAEAYRRYKLAREHGAHVPFGKLFQRIQDFFANIADHYKELTGTMTDADIARRAFRELANGKAWKRNAGEGRGARKYAGEVNADENPVDNRNGQNDNEGEERDRFIDRWLKEKVPKNGRTSIASDVKDGIAKFSKEITPENIEDVFDSLHCVRMLRATFNDNGRMQNYDNGLDYAQKMAAYMYGYARRCFENDERIKRQLALRGTSVGRPAEVRDAHAESRPGRADEGAPRNGGQTLQGTSLAKHGNVKALQELYDRLVDEAYHGQHYSVSRSEPQDGFSRAKNPRKYSIAYHGTQHDFDQFDVGKIGTGEGSQVHGWGLYFAKDRKVSEKYRDVLSEDKTEVTLNGKRYHRDHAFVVRDDAGNKASDAAEQAYISLNRFDGSKEKAIERLESDRKDEIDLSKEIADREEASSHADQAKVLQDAIAMLKNVDTRFERGKGHLLEAEIPDDNVMLNEEGTVGEQPDAVKDAVYKIAEEHPDMFDGESGKQLDGWSGAEIYDKIAKASSERDASLLLNEHGVKGIKYDGITDGISYVVFDDKAVSIIRKLSASRAKEAHARATFDIKAEVMKAFPGAKDVRDMGDRITFTMPNGAKVAIRIHDNMTVTGEEESRARRAHGIADGVTITVNGSEYTIGRQAVIDLSQRGEVGTVYHEALHAAMDLLFDDKTKAALRKKYGSEEKIADAYRKFMLAEARGGHVPFGKPLRAIRDFFRALAAHIAPIRKACGDAWTAQKAFEDLASGKAWEPASKKSHGFSLFSHAEAAERPIDNEAARGDNEVEIKANTTEAARTARLDAITKVVSDKFMEEMAKIEKLGVSDARLKQLLHDGTSPLKRNVLAGIDRQVNRFATKDIHEMRRRVADILTSNQTDEDVKRQTRASIANASADEIRSIFAQYRDMMKEAQDHARLTFEELAYGREHDRQFSGLSRAEDVERANHKHGGTYEISRERNEEELNHGGRNYSVSRSEDQDGSLSAQTEEETKKRAKGWLHSVGDRLAKGLHLKGEKIMLEEDAKDPSRDINLKQYIAASPSRVAEKVKTFRVLYVMADRAMNKVVSHRDGFERKLNKALALASSKDDRQDLFDLLLRGDAEGKEWTRQELIDDGVKENVADAYIQIRRQLNRAYHLVNDARRKPTPKSETVGKDRLAFLKANKFVTDLSVKDKGDGKYLVSYKEYKNYPKTYKEVGADMVERFQHDPGIQVVDVKEAKTESGHAITDADGEPLYDVTTTEGPAELHKLKGYIPHFFHEYFLRVVDKDGNSRTIGSARNQREAVMQAEAWMKDHKLADGETIHVQPKVFDINKALGVTDDDFAPVMGDKDFLRVQKNLAKQNDMTLAEAKDMLDGAVRLKGRHRFFGNALHRTGAAGFETDLDWALRHYFNSASRYVAMETEFKPKAISYFERVFGAFDKDYNNNLLAKYCKDYINDINGTPSSLEQAISKALNSTWLFKKVVIPTFGDRAALTLGNGIANKISYMTLGLNMSSALLNFSQLMNSAAYIGDVRSLGQMMKKGMHRDYSLHELRILKETGVLNDIGIDSGSGYDKLRGGGSPSLGTGKIARALTGVNRGVDFLGQKSMYFFQQADSICRRGTVLVAYEKARKEGKTHAEAIAYAKDVNNKANFQYGTQDAPNIFRRGSIVSQLALQFKKYGFKELEVMADFSPWSKKTSRKQKLMFWGMYAMLCGAMGVPALDWLDEIFGEKTGFYTKDELQKAIIGLCGGNKKLAVSLMYGIPAAFNINLSSRAGMSDVIPTSLGDFAGPTISKSVRLAQDLLGGDYANALRDVNPGLYNLYAAGTGESRGKRDRLNDRYVTAWDRILRAVGFRSVDETIPTDMQRIISRDKAAATKERQEAQDAYIQNPTSENKQRLKDLGIKEKDVQKEATKKNQTREERTQGTVPKKDKDKYKPLTDFMKE